MATKQDAFTTWLKAKGRQVYDADGRIIKAKQEKDSCRPSPLNTDLTKASNKLSR